MASIYLDNNSTTAIHPEVIQAMSECLAAGHVNPASQHASGRAARRVLEQARETIGSLLGASMSAPHQDSIIFTSGGTESNNLAIRGLVREPGEILISAIEHPSSLAAADELKSIGYEVIPIPVDQDGFVSVSDVRDLLSSRTRLVCVMFGNNEIGTLQPIEELAQVCNEANVPLHCDCVQAVGKMSLAFGKLGATTISFSAHKFHGPRGIGGLIVKNRVNLQPLLVGGSQQLGLRPGTESVTLAVGMAKALELSQQDLHSKTETLRQLRDQLQQLLLSGCAENEIPCVAVGAEPRLPHTLNVSFPGLDRQALVMALDLAGIECSTGSACTSGSSEPSHVLLAMGLDDDQIAGSIRLSLSTFSTAQEVAEVASRMLPVITRLAREK